MKSTEQLVLEAQGIENLEIFSAISEFNPNAIDQVAFVKSLTPNEVIIVRGYRRTLGRGSNSFSNWSWNDTTASPNEEGGGDEGNELWTPIEQTNSYASRARYYCQLHNNPNIGTKTNFFAAASRTMKLYATLDVLSDSPSGIPGDLPSSVFLRYNRILSEFLRNVVNPEIANQIATNAPAYRALTVGQRDIALVEREQEAVQGFLDELERQNPSDFNELITVANASFWATENVSGFLGFAGFPQDARIAIDKATDRAGRSLNFRNKADRIMIGLAIVEGVVEDKAAGRPIC